MSGNFYLVRHGETYWNKQNIMHGQYDIPLDSKGIEQAKKVAIKLKDIQFDICYCSPLDRAKKTCNEILKYHTGLKVIYDDRLMELSKGKLEGAHCSSEKMLKKEDPNVLQKYNIESKYHFFERVKSLLVDIQKLYTNKNILIVSHSGTIKMCMFYLNPPQDTINDAYYKVHIKNCDYIKLENKIPNKSAKLIIHNYENHKVVKENKKMKIGIYPMVADVLHTGHMTAIEEAKKHCDYLIVALHCCPNYKTPVQTIYERFMQLRAVKWIDEIIPYTDVYDARNMLSSVDYDIYFLGEDHEGKEWECSDLVKSLNKEIYFISRKHPYSSTYVKEKIINAYKNDEE